MRTLTAAFALPLAFALLVFGGCKKAAEGEAASGDQAAAKDRGGLPALPDPEPTTKPAEPAKPMAKATTDTANDALGSLPEGVGLEPGKQLPDVAVRALDGGVVKLASFVEESPALFVFYRGGWCPYCNFQVREMTKAYPEFQQRKVVPVLISVDSPDESARTSATYEIPFPVLSDSNLEAHKAFNVAFEVDADTLAKYKSFGIDLEKASGKDHHNLAVPSVFLVGTDKKILWAHADVDYKTRPSPAQLLAAIDGELAR